MSRIVLDKYQEAVANHTHGSAGVSAVAGAGKTAVLVERTKRLLATKPDRPVLLLAFNKDAATTLEDRLGRPANCEIRTYHAFGKSLLDEWYGMNWRLRALVESPVSLVGQAMRRVQMKGDAMLYEALLRLAKERNVDLEAPNGSAQVRAALPGIQYETAEDVVRIARAYEAMKDEQRLMDYADMLYRVVRAIRVGGPHIERLKSRYSHVMGDEAQDGSPARWLIFRHVGKGAQSILAVGDAEQSINGFAGADRKEFLSFLNTAQHRYQLPVIRRSTRAIVDLANRVRTGDRALARDDAEIGAVPQVRGFVSIAEELDHVAEAARGLLPAQVAVVTRTNGYAAAAQLALARAGVPARVRGGTGAWGSDVGKMFLTYLQAAEGKTVPSKCRRIANRPKRYVRTEDLNNSPTFGDLRLTQSGAKFADDIQYLSGCSFADRARQVKAWLTPEEDALEVDASNDDAQALDGLLADALARGSIREIEDASRREASVPLSGSVEVSTVHKFKGDEADHVFVVGVHDKHWPHATMMEDAEGVQEELRILYVAVTRAKTTLHVSGAGRSQFLEKLGAEPHASQGRVLVRRKAG